MRIIYWRLINMLSIIWLKIILILMAGILTGWHLKQWNYKINLKKGNKIKCLKN